MGFRNELVGGITLLRKAIRSAEYTAPDPPSEPGSGWSIERDGTATFANVILTAGELIAYGDDLFSNGVFVLVGADDSAVIFGSTESGVTGSSRVVGRVRDFPSDLASIALQLTSDTGPRSTPDAAVTLRDLAGVVSLQFDDVPAWFHDGEPAGPHVTGSDTRTTDASGYATFFHSLGATPATVQVTPTAPSGGTNIPVGVVVTAKTSTTFTARFLNQSGAVLNGVSVTVDYLVSP